MGFGPTHDDCAVYLFSKQAPYSRLGMTPFQKRPALMGGPLMFSCSPPGGLIYWKPEVWNGIST